MVITRKEFAEEDRRMKVLHRQGWTYDGPLDKNLKGWLRGWRLVGQSQQRKTT